MVLKSCEKVWRYSPCNFTIIALSSSFLPPLVFRVLCFVVSPLVGIYREQVRGVSSIQRLSVTQLNSEEPFVASVTLVADAGKAAVSREEVVDKSGAGGQGGATPGRILAAGTPALAESVKRVLAQHNIGRNTVEMIVLPPGDAPRGAVGRLEEAVHGELGRSGGGGGGNRGAFLSADESRRSGHDQAERGQVGRGGEESGGKSHGGGHWHAHGHGQCSGHGHSHGHAASVDLV